MAKAHLQYLISELEVLSTRDTSPVKLLLCRDVGKLFLFLSVQIPDKHCDIQALAFTITINHAQTARERQVPSFWPGCLQESRQ